mgnify:CR=1 FL=1
MRARGASSLRCERRPNSPTPPAASVASASCSTEARRRAATDTVFEASAFVPYFDYTGTLAVAGKISSIASQERTDASGYVLP